MINHNNITRRHALCLIASAGGLLALSPSIAHAVTSNHVASWRGIALGGEASLTLVHPNQDKAQKTIKRLVDELVRLESIFSIYDESSKLSQLNAEGYLLAPPMELVMVLRQARAVSEATGGMFDITVQPIWEELYNDVPNKAPIAQQMLSISSEQILLGKGQKITLNGIAQGAITDYLHAMLQREGFENIMLNTGEIRAHGYSANGDLWRAALGSKDGPVLSLENQSLATSEVGDKRAHLFNPKTQEKGNLFERVSVTAPSAAIADGLSTAFSLIPESQWPYYVDRLPWQNISINAARKDGSVFVMSSNGAVKGT